MDAASCAADMSARGMMYIALVAHPPRGFAPKQTVGAPPPPLCADTFATRVTHLSSTSLPPRLPAHSRMDRLPRPPHPPPLPKFRPQPTSATTLLGNTMPLGCVLLCVALTASSNRDTEKELLSSSTSSRPRDVTFRKMDFMMSSPRYLARINRPLHP